MKNILLITALTLPLPLLADSESALRERIEQLEQRIRVLEQHHSVPVAAPQTERRSPRDDTGMDYGYAMVQYWLGRQSGFDEQAAPALAAGRMKLGETFLLNPQEYGVGQDDGGLFSSQLDPSQNPVASFAVTGRLRPPAGGDYTLLIKPTPPREVGGSGNVEMAIEIHIDGRPVFSQTYSSTLASRRVSLSLPEQGAAFRMEVVARSPGYGPSPTRSRLFVGLEADGAVGAEPIGQFLMPN